MLRGGYIEKDGYTPRRTSMETFLVNETEEDVWYDNFSVQSTTALIVQETHYDPWGVVLKGLDYQYGGIKANKYLYQGKEWIEELDLDFYDFHSRGYDPVIGRTWQVDPHSENFLDWSPYSWTGDNPTSNIDPTGMDWFVSNQNGVVINIQGQSEFNYGSLQEEYGSAIANFIYELSGGASNDSWENFGADDMFDTEDNKLSENLNLLTVMTEDASSQFMLENGYHKGVEEKVSELSIDLTEAEPNGLRFDNITSREIKESKVSYFRPDEFGRDKASEKISKTEGFMFKMTRTTYRQKKQYWKRSIDTNSYWYNNYPSVIGSGVSIYQDIIDIMEENAKNKIGKKKRK